MFIRRRRRSEMFRYANDDKVIEIVGDLLLICKDDPDLFV